MRKWQQATLLYQKNPQLSCRKHYHLAPDIQTQRILVTRYLLSTKRLMKSSVESRKEESQNTCVFEHNLCAVVCMGMEEPLSRGHPNIGRRKVEGRNAGA